MNYTRIPKYNIFGVQNFKKEFKSRERGGRRGIKFSKTIQYNIQLFSYTEKNEISHFSIFFVSILMMDNEMNKIFYKISDYNVVFVAFIFCYYL